VLREDQIERYSRHVLVPDVGGTGQLRLLAGAVTVAVRPGDGAAVAALAYLAAAGVGTLRLAGDAAGPVDDADLAAGLLYRAGDAGRPRLEALAERIAALNPDVAVVAAAPGDPPIAIDPAGRLADALVAGGAAAVAALAALIEATA